MSGVWRTTQAANSACARMPPGLFSQNFATPGVLLIPGLEKLECTNCAFEVTALESPRLPCWEKDAYEAHLSPTGSQQSTTKHDSVKREVRPRSLRLAREITTFFTRKAIATCRKSRMDAWLGELPLPSSGPAKRHMEAVPSGRVLHQANCPENTLRPTEHRHH